jgi:pimeloyl-ACP methyl ester carboxylesterase
VSRVVVRGVMRTIFSPEPVPAERADRELSQLAARPEILSSMVHVTQGRPSDRVLRAAAHIRCPALFLHGEHDALVPARCARAIHERIVSNGGRSTFRLVAGAGHMLVHFQAAEVATCITDFIEQ